MNGKKHQYLFFSHKNNKALQKDGWKAVYRNRSNHWELYDLSADLNETNNLSGQRPERLKKMKTRWKQLNKKFRKQSGNR